MAVSLRGKEYGVGSMGRDRSVVGGQRSRRATLTVHLAINTTFYLILNQNAGRY